MPASATTAHHKEFNRVPGTLKPAVWMGPVWECLLRFSLIRRARQRWVWVHAHTARGGGRREKRGKGGGRLCVRLSQGIIRTHIRRVKVTESNSKTRFHNRC